MKIKYTNKYNLPDAFMEAVLNDTYSKGDSKYSITELLKPPYMCQLERIHADKLEIDISDLFFSLLGSGWHLLMENRIPDSPRYVKERRLFESIDGINISGQVDLYDKKDELLLDWKISAVWSFKLGKNDWIGQVNMLAWLLEKKGVKPKKLGIFGGMRNWERSRARRRERDYPRIAIDWRTCKPWPKARQEAYIKSRIGLHEEAQGNPVKIPSCNKEERWGRGPHWAVKRKQQKNALRGGVCFSEEAAKEFIDKLDDKKDVYIEYRPEVRRRCEENAFCLVSRFCPAYQEWLREHAHK